MFQEAGSCPLTTVYGEYDLHDAKVVGWPGLSERPYFHRFRNIIAGGPPSGRLATTASLQLASVKLLRGFREDSELTSKPFSGEVPSASGSRKPRYRPHPEPPCGDQRNSRHGGNNEGRPADEREETEGQGEE